jgi:hypothetical protein
MLIAQDLAELLYRVLGAPPDKDGQVQLPEAMVAYAEGFCACLKAGILNNASGTVQAVSLLNVVTGSASEGKATLIPALMTAIALPALKGPLVMPENTAVINYVMNSGKMSFAFGTILGVSTNTPLSPGVLTLGSGVKGTFNKLQEETVSFKISDFLTDSTGDETGIVGQKYVALNHQPVDPDSIRVTASDLLFSFLGKTVTLSNTPLQSVPLPIQVFYTYWDLIDDVSVDTVESFEPNQFAGNSVTLTQLPLSISRVSNNTTLAPQFRGKNLFFSVDTHTTIEVTYTYISGGTLIGEDCASQVKSQTGAEGPLQNVFYAALMDYTQAHAIGSYLPGTINGSFSAGVGLIPMTGGTGAGGIIQ